MGPLEGQFADQKQPPIKSPTTSLSDKQILTKYEIGVGMEKSQFSSISMKPPVEPGFKKTVLKTVVEIWQRFLCLLNKRCNTWTMQSCPRNVDV